MDKRKIATNNNPGLNPGVSVAPFPKPIPVISKNGGEGGILLGDISES